VQVQEKLVYDSRIWVSGITNLHPPYVYEWGPNNAPGSLLGWRLVNAASGQVVPTKQKCGQQIADWNYTGWTFTSPDGSQHPFYINTSYCSGPSSGSAYATDASGYFMSVANYAYPTVYAPDGTRVYPTPTDPNGNYVTPVQNPNNVYTLTDTLGRNPVAYSTNGSSQNYYDVLTATGSTQRFTVNYAPITVSSNFGVSGINEYPPTPTNAVQSISLPDRSSYQFGYDSYGELNSITLPTGGQITFTYANFADAYGNTNRWVNTRVSGGQTWTYAPSIAQNSVCMAIQGSGTIDGCQQSTITKPAGEKIIYTFLLTGGAWNSQQAYYSASGALAATLNQVFDLGNTCSQCQGAAFVRVLTQTVSMPTVGGTLTKQTQYSYDSIYYGNVTSLKEWNFTLGSPGPNPDRETDISYLNSAPYVGANIINKPTSTTT
jgi:YD repeat-containing protein